MAHRPSVSAPSGTTTHKNQRPPLAPLSSQIANAARLSASQDPQARRHAGENRPWPDHAGGPDGGPRAGRTARRAAHRGLRELLQVHAGQVGHDLV